MYLSVSVSTSRYPCLSIKINMDSSVDIFYRKLLLVLTDANETVTFRYTAKSPQCQRSP